jgi:hypothetical protein
MKKKGAMMQKVNVSHGKLKMDKMVRRRGLPCVRRSKSLHRERVVGGKCRCRLKEKRDEGAKKEQRKRFKEK